MNNVQIGRDPNDMIVVVRFWIVEMGYFKCLEIFTTVWRKVCIIPMIQVLAILSLVLTGLQCSDSSQVHGLQSTGTAVQQVHSRDLDELLFLSDRLQSDGRLEKESEGSPASPNFDLETQTRQLMDTSRATSGLTIQEKGDSNSNRAPDVEVEALVAFKGAIISDPFNALGSWKIVADVNSSNICTGWVGVTCSPKFPSHVVALNLSNMQLAANFSSALLALSHLSFLQSLDLSINVLSGSIPGEALTNFSHLSYLNVSHNAITGDIPSEIGELVYLHHLDISHNTITGGIPSEIGELVSLQYLDMTQNHMTGQISESLANCSLIRSINLSGNLLEGIIPIFLGTLSGLQYLNLSRNSLSGDVPGALGNCSSLHVLDIRQNFRIGGLLPQQISELKQLNVLITDFCSFLAFPSWIVNLTSLSMFSMYGNQIRGEIPGNIGELEFLRHFIVAENQMTGVIPQSISNLTSLLKFHTALNNFIGHIPSQIGMLPNLQILLTQFNNHTGVIPSSLANCSTLARLGLGSNSNMDPQPIPSWIGSLTNLIYLDLRNMNLQGEIPGYIIGQLYKLQKLQFDSNNLTGTIPTALQNCTSLYSLTFSHNHLTGKIPSELGVLGKMSMFLGSSNSLIGFFPEFIANWTELARLDIQNNRLSGPLDGHMKIDQLPQLLWVQAGINDFEGVIPEALGNSSTISHLYLHENRLSGAIPASLGNMTSLQLLDVHDNNFHGQIPISLLASCRQLVQLNLGQNKLGSSIPVAIGQLSLLTNLWLNDNKFKGLLPSSIANCSKISIMDLSYNQLEGDIPAVAISAMSTALISLDLSHNLFKGSWPKEFAELINIEIINVSFNNIFGSIPLGLGHCNNLKSLDISFNNLTGEIPQDLGVLAHLDFFNASFNEFIGPIPQSGFFNTNRINGSSFLGNLGLCGPIAIIGLRNDQECEAISQNLTAHPHYKDLKQKAVWIPIMAVGLLLLVGATVIILGNKFGWTLNRGGHSPSHMMLNFDKHMKLSEAQVLRTIDLQNVIGVGRRSVVYKGALLAGEQFALKKILRDGDGNNQHADSKTKSAMDLNTPRKGDVFKEAKILAKLRHKNILSCYIFYSNLDIQAIILEYMCGGSLQNHLHEIEPCKLAWPTRLKVVMGVAQGLKYLHHDFPEPLIHRDLKPSNILLDADFEPKVSDFDISKFVDTEHDGQAFASTFCGTIGYMPPEYASQPWVSTSGDVYSYGIVLLEILTRRQPCLMDALDDQGRDLRNWILDSFPDKPSEVLDPSLKRECSLDNNAMEQIMLLLKVGLFCTSVEPRSRPSMVDVIRMLTDIINLGNEPSYRKVDELALDISPYI